ncbi:aminodeoxychorismate synthase component I [Sphingobium sufflavum]|uniref:aminodeoxychorismate synthase component I n=1 Tax=Sphingobium sufflavum TaxID=1129547 RepID=UPI001F227FC2|nr:aminodeoxychorismate synthase component I [Sphingobium sufflavum]MCE7795246.1 aminodeoxychorismate synthase component I [Sphingobium sufflavum]
MTATVPVALPPSPEPFVLLDDARPVAGAVARLYRDPVGEVAAWRPDAVPAALKQLRAATSRGLHAAGYLHYEAGHGLEPALTPLAQAVPESVAPLLWFGLFERCEMLSADTVPGLLPSPALSGHGTACPVIDAESYRAAVGRVLDYIRAGDIYQANLTFAASVGLPGDPLAAYAAIRPRAAMGHGALIRQDWRHILCFSPENFFSVTNGLVETLPMKGTAPRHVDPATDAALAAELRADPKQRAENLMIVDLIRNDLSRVCAAGSVTVPDLFTVESYPTVHQMTSRVIGRLCEGVDAIDTLAALFPCGSVTGAPKIRAMQVIAEVEQRVRGIYTGAIGSLSPDGDARFNVAIRTISLEKDAQATGMGAAMGLGSGIVADSLPMNEWTECLDKARFLERAPDGRATQGIED